MGEREREKNVQIGTLLSIHYSSNRNTEVGDWTPEICGELGKRVVLGGFEYITLRFENCEFFGNQELSKSSLQFILEPSNSLALADTFLHLHLQP